MRKLVPRAARYAAYGAGALLVAVVAAALLVPAFLDTPAVERELKGKLSQALRGEIAWEKLSIRLLPSPRGSLSKVRAEIPGVVSVRAEQVDAHLRLLPLLHGRAEIASVSLSKPEISLDIAPPSPAPKEEAGRAQSPVEGYRGAVAAIRSFAPEAVLDIEDAGVDVRVVGMAPLRVRALDLHASTGSEGIEVELTAEGDAWSRFKLSGSVAFADLAGSAQLEVSDLKPQPWLDRFLAKSPVGVALAAASVRANARTDGKTNLECSFDLRAASVELRRAAERIQVPDVTVGGKVAADNRQIMLSLSGAQLGASKLAGGSLRYALRDNSIASSADFDLDLPQVMDASRRLVPDEAAKALAAFAVSGRAQGRATFEMRAAWNARVDIRKSDSSVTMEDLPGPVRLAAAAVNITGDTVRIDRADVAMLDGRAIASATIGYGKGLRIEGTVPDGSVGEKLLAWLWKTAGSPPQVTLKTPIRIAVQRAAWSPKQPLDVAATGSFDAGPSVAAELGWTPGTLELRRAAIKDARSDATLALRVKKGLLEGRFSGSLQSASIGAMLKSAQPPTGGASGDMRFRVDLDHPERFSVVGKLTGKSVDLSWLLGRAVTIDRVDLAADGTTLRIREATVNWAGQHFALRGELARASDGAPIIDAQLESPGVVIDELLKGSGGKQDAPNDEKAKAEEALWTQWPLPVRGRIALRSDFIQYGERKAAPVAATLVLEEQKASLEVLEIQLCGISLPLTAEATSAGVVIAARISARKQQLEQTARCLTERGLLISGEFDLSADLRTRGKLHQLLPNLEGTVRVESRRGRVMKFAMLGNILAMQNVAGLLDKSGPKLDEAGFPYRGLTASGRFDKGKFIIEESSFTSDAIGLAATGSISLEDGYNCELNVLVAPLGFVNAMARKIPLFGDVAGVVTSVPVRVSGDIRDPRVLPLGIRAVGSQLVEILEKTARVPGKLLPRESEPKSGP